MVLGPYSSLKRSSTSLDLKVASFDGDSDSLSSQPQKRMSSLVFGWDHYGNHDSNALHGKEYHSWRQNKRCRRHTETQQHLSDSFNVMMYRQTAKDHEETKRVESIGWSKKIHPLKTTSSDVPYTNESQYTKNSIQTNSLLVNDVTEMLAIVMM